MHRETVFRAYDIRGRVPRDFDGDWTEKLGRACAAYFLRRSQNLAVVGRDCRRSSPALHDALIRGMLSAGLDVLSVGMVPTPVQYFAVCSLGRRAGVMITASHNPPEWNGFKIWCGPTTLHGQQIQDIGRLLEAGNFPTGRGLHSEHDILPAYEAAVLSRVRLARPMKVVVDGGNGVGGPALVSILRAMGAEVVPLYCEPDGAFPNHHPDPVVEANMADLRARVLAEGAELGLGLDGDADRLGVVDAAGRLRNGDELLAILARDLLERRPGALVLGDVKCSDRLFDDIRRRGGQARMIVTGHSLAKAIMLETGAALAGELSGHMFFNEGWFGFDDALYAAARLLDFLSRCPVPLTELPGWPPAWASREIQLPCPEARKAGVVRRAREHYAARFPVSDVDGARVRFPHGWGLVRASNTQPVLVLRFEARSPDALERLQNGMTEQVRRWIEEEKEEREEK